VEVLKDRLYLNTHDPNAATVAKKFGFGIELDDYVYPNANVDLDGSKTLFDILGMAFSTWIPERL